MFFLAGTTINEDRNDLRAGIRLLELVWCRSEFNSRDELQGVVCFVASQASRRPSSHRGLRCSKSNAWEPYSRQVALPGCRANNPNRTKWPMKRGASDDNGGAKAIFMIWRWSYDFVASMALTSIMKQHQMRLFSRTRITVKSNI